MPLTPLAVLVQILAAKKYDALFIAQDDTNPLCRSRFFAGLHLGIPGRHPKTDSKKTKICSFSLFLLLGLRERLLDHAINLF
jgi:hypothetical protein